jgi:hypothetical protein
MMELDMATVEKRRYRKSKEHKKVEESHSDGDFDKLFNNISFEIKEDNEIDEMFGDITRGNFCNAVEEHERFKEEEEFANTFHTTTFKFQEDEGFDRMFNNTTNNFEEDMRFAEMYNTAKGSVTNKPVNMFTTDKFEENLDIHEVQCPLLRGGCNQEEFEVFEQQWC